MTDPLTDEQLAAIEARASAATRGPWDSIGERVYAGGASAWVVAESKMWGLDGERDDYAADAAFVAGARADVPALLAEVRRLRAEHLTPDEAQAVRASYGGGRIDCEALDRAEVKLAAIVEGVAS